MKLNLGCGKEHKPGYLNVDWAVQDPPPDERVDLSVFPWPWPSGSVDEVYCEHWIEHMPDYEAVVTEVHRVLRPGGTWRVEVPHCRSPLAHLPGHHVQYFSTFSLPMLEIGSDYAFPHVPLFRTLSLRHVFGRCLPGPVRWLAPVLGLLANLGGVKWAKAWDMAQLPVENMLWEGEKV